MRRRGHAGGGSVPRAVPQAVPRGAVPELAARGVIQQVFPLHEQRILKRLMKSWVQAVCEAQPLGEMLEGAGEGRGLGVPVPLMPHLAPTDEICDYFGVKIAMYFAWLGFYTSAMVYPAVFGSILYTITESDQVRGKWGQSPWGWAMGRVTSGTGRD